MIFPNDIIPKAHQLFARIKTKLYLPTLNEIPKRKKCENKTVETKEYLKTITFLNEGVSTETKLLTDYLIDEGKTNPSYHSIFTKEPYNILRKNI